MHTKKVFTIIVTVLMLLALLPVSVQAATWENVGITLITPDNFESCSIPAPFTATASGLVASEPVTVWIFYPNGDFPSYNTNASGTGTLEIPFAYNAPITGEQIFRIRIDVYRNGLLTKVEGQWHVTCGETPPPPPPPPGGQGCTPGYWKNHLQAWSGTGYSPTSTFLGVFSVHASFSPDTFITAVNLGGGGEEALARHAVSALLNAASTSVDYQYTPAQIITMVQQAYATGNFEGVKNLFAAANETYCPLN